jgi:hypothetical protein
MPQLPETIRTGCAQLDLVWTRFADEVLERSQILIPDTDDGLNWHAFLGHSIDMQGFRAAEFAGVDPLTKRAPNFVPLKERGLGVPELAALWRIWPIQQHLLTGVKTLPGRSPVPMEETYEVLEREGGSDGASLADAFKWFPWRKGHWSVRALLQNSAIIAKSGGSFRVWLQNECRLLGESRFPPPDFRKSAGSVTLERLLRARLEKTLYQVGPALAAYMLCDWQLWLWKHGKTAVFANFKLDSFHEQFVERYGGGRIPMDEDGFASWWMAMHPQVPPRLINECIWLGVEHKIV